MDRLIDRIDELGNPSVVGLDPSLDMMPDALAREMYGAYGRTPRAVSEMFFLYNKAIIDVVADIVPAVKPQIAMYEMYGADGIAAYIRTCEYASGRGLYVVGDIKRGDISSTAEAYAAHLSGAAVGPADGAADEVGGTGGATVGPADGLSGAALRVDVWREDAITVNPYFGADGIEPFTKACRETGKSVFVLVKTSNRSSAELQDVVTVGAPLDLASGASARVAPDGCGARFYERVAAYVDSWGEGLVGERGYSAVGAVVGATHPEVGRALREAHPRMFFLVPGYGAQGARAADLAGFFDAEGRGCIVNSSRGIIAAWRRSAAGEALRAAAPGADRALFVVAEAARAAALTMADDLRTARNGT
ncbi:MAG: orotidine-5'-phosphate decarboxylase [Clostridiales Family XIII bacterium]|nr:orotidine-5'-phosphate decarboxylase [Clostridiales Family XIII bacterium]